jgi:ZIP family zinc transporter
VGSAGLATIERRLRSMAPLPPISGGAVDVLTAEQVLQRDSHARTRALRIGITIALAIGLHNFAEGLAIGVSASAGNISLATVLIVGFALHNATEGGAILYVIGEIWNGMRRYGHRELGLWLLAFGFFVGVATDLLVAYGGG